MHVLFGGTKLLQSTGDKSAKIKTPDAGCLAVVLRTGFGTAQGALDGGGTAAPAGVALRCVAPAVALCPSDAQQSLSPCLQAA